MSVQVYPKSGRNVSRWGGVCSEQDNRKSGVRECVTSQLVRETLHSSSILQFSNMYVEFLDSYGFPKQFRNIGFKFKYLPLPTQPRIPNSHITIWYLPGKFDIEMWVFDIFQELLLVLVSY